MTREKILLVEDERGIYELLRPEIEQLGLRLDHAATGAEGLERVEKESFALTILDRRLPDMDGFDILREIRRRSGSSQVLMLTSLGSELDKVLGLELGADDYVIKPFSIPELVARIRARLRIARAARGLLDQSHHGGGSEHMSVLRFDELEVDIRRRQVSIGERVFDLTTLEFDLIVFLSSSPGRPFDRKTIFESVWGFEVTNYEANVNVAINRIRRKIEKDPREPRYLLTVHGFGYKWCQPE